MENFKLAWAYLEGVPLLMEMVRLAGGFALFFVLFLPIENLWPLKRKKYLARPLLRTDLLHFFVTNIISKFSIVLIMTPVIGFLSTAPFLRDLHAAASGQPAWVQLSMAIILSDLVHYWMHRWAHTVPFLWKFHAVHHSVEDMDWLATVRIHPVDQVLRRIAVFTTLTLAGLSESAFFFFWFVVSPIHAMFLHANFRIKIPIIRFVLTTPEFHHFHHVVDPINKNYSARLPFFDWLFGTLYMPRSERPGPFGIPDPIPSGYFAQLVYPFRALRTNKN